MITTKARLTVTVDRELLRAGEEAVRAGRAASLSSWVNSAMGERAARDRRLRMMAEAVAAYEAEHGAISDLEMAMQERADRGSALVVRGPGASRAPSGRGRAKR